MNTATVSPKLPGHTTMVYKLSRAVIPYHCAQLRGASYGMRARVQVQVVNVRAVVAENVRRELGVGDGEDGFGFA